MATVEQRLVSHLRGSTDLAALTGDRVRAHRLDSNETDGIVVSRVSSVGLPNFQSDSGVLRGRFDLTTYGRTFSSAYDISEVTKNLILRWSGSTSEPEIIDVSLDNEIHSPVADVDETQIVLETVVWYEDLIEIYPDSTGDYITGFIVFDRDERFSAPNDYITGVSSTGQYVWRGRRKGGSEVVSDRWTEVRSV